MGSVCRVFFMFVIISLPHMGQAKSGFGVNAGVGIPFLLQAGVNYRLNDTLGFSAAYNTLNLTVDSASVDLKMPEFLVHYHPFQGAFFIGAGIGQESLKVTATDTITSQQASAEVTAMTGIIKTGWMWGAVSGGLWFGVDISYISPFSPSTNINAPGVPTTSQEYQDVVDAANKFGETGYINITFARLGYIF
jgi:hypothetical protein